MPTEEEVAEMFDALVSNGLEFVEASIEELLANRQTFSVAHFATGVELLLKARLFKEHWTLVAADPHGCAWTGLKDGTVSTTPASDLCDALTRVTGTPLADEKVTFKGIFDHRNRALHFIPSPDRAGVAAEQCSAWYSLHNLLTHARRWGQHFEPYADRVRAIDARMLEYRPYLQARFDAQSTRLAGLDKAGRVFECPACHFRSAVLPDKARMISAFECPVCNAEDYVALVSCGARIPLEEIPLDCSCGGEHDREELLEALDPTPSLGPKDSLTYEADRGYCGECLDLEISVAPQAGGYVCVNCGVEFEAAAISRCDWCNETWANYDTEFSYYTGCEWCDGHSPRD